MNQERLPPHDTDAEEAVLGSVLIDGELIHSLSLEPDDFYYEQNLFIYQAMLDLKKQGVSINQITLSNRLNEAGKLDLAGGTARLSLLVSVVPTSLDCLHYAAIVKRQANFRKLIASGNQLIQMGYAADGDAIEALNKADAMLLKMKQSAGASHIITPDERYKIMFDRYNGLYNSEAGVAVETGLYDLDRRLGGGLFPGDMIVIGARPGVGKTTLMECIANHVGQTGHVLFCSGEMNVLSLSDRDVASEVGIPVERIRLGGYDDVVYDAIMNKAIPAIVARKVYHLDASRHFQLNTANIYQAASEVQSRYGLSLVVIDYLNLLADKYGTNNNDRLGYITRNVKEIAMDMNLPVLAAHQLSRAPEGREDKRPQLHDLRDSGNVEQDADVVIFLFRESYYGKENDNITELLIAKNRQGKSGKRVKVLWDEEHQVYRNLVREEA